MSLLTIELHNWRLFHDTRVAIEKKNLLLHGDNGSGKTSFLSALFSLYTGRPWPTTVMREHLRSGQPFFGLRVNPSWYISGIVSPQGRVVIKSENEKSEEWKYAVMTYSPDDNYWLTQPRAKKLALIDEWISVLIGDGYRHSLKKLERAVQAKTSLIHSYREKGLLDQVAWNQYSEVIKEMSDTVWNERKLFFDRMNDQLTGFRSWISTNISSMRFLLTYALGSKKIIDTSHPPWPKATEMKNMELRAGRVLYGAQRDDFQVLVNSAEASVFFSRGEMRSFILFVRFLLRQWIGDRVLWLLDDVFNELDHDREFALLEALFQNSDDWVLATGTKIPQKNKHLAMVHTKDLW